MFGLRRYPCFFSCWKNDNFSFCDVQKFSSLLFPSRISISLSPSERPFIFFHVEDFVHLSSLNLWYLFERPFLVNVSSESSVGQFAIFKSSPSILLHPRISDPWFYRETRSVHSKPPFCFSEQTHLNFQRSLFPLCKVSMSKISFHLSERECKRHGSRKQILAPLAGATKSKCVRDSHPRHHPLASTPCTSTRRTRDCVLD